MIKRNYTIAPRVATSKIITPTVSIQQALRTSIFHGAIPPKQLAKRLGVPYTYLTNAVNLHQPLKFPLKRLLPLMKTADNYEPLEFLCRASGRICLKIPTINREVGSKEFLLMAFGLSDHYKDLCSLFREFLSVESQPVKNRLSNQIDSKLWALAAHCLSLKLCLEKRSKIKQPKRRE